MRPFVIGAFISLWALRITAGESCPPQVNDDIQRCVTPVAQFAEALGLDVKESNSAIGSDRLMPSMGAQVFRQLCAKISTFSICVRKAKRQCPNHITLTLISASYGYLCTEGYDVFVKNADCLMRLDQEETVRYCHERTMADIKNSSSDTGATMTQKLTRMCDSLNYFAVCVEEPVLRTCGEPAWNVIARVLHDTTKTLMPSCEFAIPVPHQSALLADVPSRLQAIGRQKGSDVEPFTAEPSGASGKSKQARKNKEGKALPAKGAISGAPGRAAVTSTIVLMAIAALSQRYL